MATEDEALLALLKMMKGIGPKTVQTPNMTVTAHDPVDVQRVLERRTAPVISMCSLKGCIGVPKKSAYDMPEIREEPDCGCS